MCYNTKFRSRQVLFTYFLQTTTLTDSELELKKQTFERYLTKLAYYRYCYYQTETSTDGKLHFQGFAQLKNRYGNTTLSKDFKHLTETGIHFCKQYATHEQNIAYCSKTHTKDGRFCQRSKPSIYGTPVYSSMKGGRPKDPQLEYSEIFKKVDDPKFDAQSFQEEMIKSHPKHALLSFDKLRRGREERVLAPFIDKKRIRAQWFYGMSGAGKSTYIRTLVQQLGYDPRTISGNGASTKTEARMGGKRSDQKKTVAVIEEIKSKYPGSDTLLKLLNGHPLEGKGFIVENNFQLVILVSLRSPWELYQDLDPEHLLELLRRIQELIKVAKNPLSFSQIDPTVDYSEYQFSSLYQPLIFHRNELHREQLRQLEEKITPPEAVLVDLVESYRLLAAAEIPDLTQLTNLTTYLINFLGTFPQDRFFQLTELVNHHRIFNQLRFQETIKKAKKTTTDHGPNPLKSLKPEDKIDFYDFYPEFSLSGIIEPSFLKRILNPSEPTFLSPVVRPPGSFLSDHSLLNLQISARKYQMCEYFFFDPHSHADFCIPKRLHYGKFQDNFILQAA